MPTSALFVCNETRNAEKRLLIDFNVGKFPPSQACNNPMSNHTTFGEPESSKYRLLRETGSLAITNKYKRRIDESSDSRHSTLVAFLISISKHPLIHHARNHPRPNLRMVQQWRLKSTDTLGWSSQEHPWMPSTAIRLVYEPKQQHCRLPTS